ncbi:uncharacterized protein LOC105787381 isoform X2 [Gossypium raimondii]|uniref:uncharacterized protein LOC105787381 isoform X2 n=1 Tax=Gossypium raimondii TaxID=29730 RepID=UPI00227C4209|nr:uncharacterized protein LOC105787381 isoform X2 [Gossypium raimondii]
MEENKEGSTKLEAQDETRKRPSIFIIGCPNVGKRTLISRLATVEFEGEEEEDSSQVVVRRWTINTKYYTADVSLCMAHLQDGFSARTLPIFNHSTALVMVFDMSNLSTLSALRDWVSYTDIQNFEILLCIGNKVDRIPAEGSSLLGNEDPSSNIRKKILEWCIDHNIEFIEACASNAEFDKCLSVDGDLQGVERLYGAISAHMWPGMVLKSGDMITEPSLPEKEDSSEEEPDYQFEYEVLSAGSAEPGNEMVEEWVSASPANTFLDIAKSVDAGNSVTECAPGNIAGCKKEELHTFLTFSGLGEKIDRMEPNAEEAGLASASEVDGGPHYDFDDLEQLMSEIGNIRSNLRLMPDFQRREMAAKLAIKMAAMFGGDSDDEEEI